MLGNELRLGLQFFLHFSDLLQNHQNTDYSEMASYLLSFKGIPKMIFSSSNYFHENIKIYKAWEELNYSSVNIIAYSYRKLSVIFIFTQKILNNVTCYFRFFTCKSIWLFYVSFLVYGIEINGAKSLHQVPQSKITSLVTYLWFCLL
jgi:hypothetical protein